MIQKMYGEESFFKGQWLAWQKFVWKKPVSRGGGGVYERDGVGIKKKKSYPKIMLRDARHVALCLARHPSPSPYYQLAHFTTLEIVQLLSLSRFFALPSKTSVSLLLYTVIPTVFVPLSSFFRYINPLYVYKNRFIFYQRRR